MTRAAALLLAALLTIAASRDVHAQARLRPFLQGSLGAGTSTGGEYEERPDYSVEVLLGRPIGGRTSSGVIVGVLLGSTFVNGSDLTCRPRADGSCVPIMPRFGYATTAIGLERLGRLGAVSVAAGPGVAAGAARRLFPALMYRADFSSPAISSAALVVSGRGLAITGVAGETVVLRSLNVGIRVR